MLDITFWPHNQLVVSHSDRQCAANVTVNVHPNVPVRLDLTLPCVCTVSRSTKFINISGMSRAWGRMRNRGMSGANWWTSSSAPLQVTDGFMLDDVIVISPDGLLLTLRFDHPFIPSDRFYSAEFWEAGFFFLFGILLICVLLRQECGRKSNLVKPHEWLFFGVFF